jgi:hypothetical protein
VCYQVSHHFQAGKVAPHEPMKQQWRKWKIRLFSEEMVGCLHPILWPGSEWRFHFHTEKTGAESEGNNQLGPLVSYKLEA